MIKGYAKPVVSKINMKLEGVLALGSGEVGGAPVCPYGRIFTYYDPANQTDCLYGGNTACPGYIECYRYFMNQVTGG